MVIGILQPGYLPWLGFFEQMYRSDVFVMYDDVQYDKHGWRNRNRIKTANGMQWLTVPVRFDFYDRQLISEVLVDNNGNWRKKHAGSLRQNYGKAPCFRQFWPIFEETYDREWELLVDLDLFLIERLAAALGIGERPLIRSSSLGLSGDRIDRLTKICRHFGADVFYEGASGRNYIDEKQFADLGIKVKYQDYHHPVYRQIYGEFIPFLSVVDLLFNHGERSLEIILQGNPPNEECVNG